MIVGLTGGIGSGKTTVGSIFKQLGVPVYEADAASKILLDEDRQLQLELKDLLGEEILTNNRINRAVMAGIVFNDPELLAKSNAIIHPAVAKHFKDWVAEQKTPYLIKEAAILFESGSYKDCDKIVVVTAPEEMRIRRVMERNGTGREEVLKRMKNQWPESEKLERADYVIRNDHAHSLIKQVLDVHQDLIRKANQRG